MTREGRKLAEREEYVTMAQNKVKRLKYHNEGTEKGENYVDKADVKRNTEGDAAGGVKTF